MSIKIVTVAESNKMHDLCAKFGEHCESVIGLAPQDYICDNSGVEIPKGTECAVVLVLPNTKHHNYEHQRNLLSTYVIPVR